jgi:hypothetical protein
MLFQINNKCNFVERVLKVLIRFNKLYGNVVYKKYGL